MAWVLQLDDGTTTVDLNDRVNTFVNVGGFQAPPPPKRVSYGGGNLARHGADLIESAYDNRRISVDFQFVSTGTAGSLGTYVRNLWSLLRQGEDNAKSGLGTAVYLRYGWESGSGTVSFRVLEGTLDLGAGLHGPALSLGTRIRNAQLSLVCEPFAYGTAESIANYLADPSFEIAASPLADWTVDASGFPGTVVRSTAQAHWGTASVLITCTGGTQAPANSNVFQRITGMTAGDTLTLGVYHYGSGLNATLTARMDIDIRNTAGTAILALTVDGTSNGTWQRLSTSTVLPADSGTVDVLYKLRRASGNNTGSVYYDNSFLYLTAQPTAWASGRSVRNHFDDNGQAHINYLDAYNIPGDMPALLQIKALETEGHGNLWVGARQAGRATSTLLFIEGEDFAASSGANFAAVAVADASNGSVGTIDLGSGTGLGSGSVYYWTRALGTPPIGAYRVLARSRVTDATGGTLAATSTVYLGMGYVYGSVTARPTATADMTILSGTSTLYALYDVGQLTVPPIQVPTGGTLGTLTLHLGFMHNNSTGRYVYVDSVLLMPVDQGYIFAAKTSTIDELWADGRSQPQALYIMSTAGVVQSVPANQQGRPPDAHPQGNRFYFAVGTGTGTGTGSANVAWRWDVTLTYVPRFMNIM